MNVIIYLAAVFACALASPALEKLQSDVEQAQGVHWAVLVAGSNGYYNYRHQADICHAYQILKKNGIPDERIIVFMFDDIAHNSENPNPGVIINHIKGPNVYPGVLKDYTGEKVTPQNFLSVLTGDSKAVHGVGSSKVLKSGPNDNVFVYFADHGATGLIAFPDDELTARQLNQAILKMHSKKMYKQMVFYIEACESGSMFEGILRKDINVFATTASNGQESSYACYYDDKLNTYLGDCYSVNWMENSDKADVGKETLQSQFKIVKKETNTSHVQEYGDLSIGKLTLSEFQAGVKKVEKVSVVSLPDVPKNPMVSENVKMHLLYKKLTRSTNVEETRKTAQAIFDEEKMKAIVLSSVKQITTLSLMSSESAEKVYNVRFPLRNHDCYEPLVKLYSRVCYPIHQLDYALRQMYILSNLCEMGVSYEIIADAMITTCSVLH